MVKAINILLLFVFMNFMSAPTVSAVLDIDLPTAGLTMSEEEETHSSSKKNNPISEEEDLKYLSLYFTPFFNTDSKYMNEFVMQTIHSINDDLVLKIPSPPPDLA